MRKRFYQDNRANTATRRCEWEGCCGAGEHKAPKSRDMLNQYHWFCMDHVREYNRAWDYFSGMNEAEVEAYNRSATCGHRPTWKMGIDAFAMQDKIIESVFGMFGDTTSCSNVPNALPEVVKDAMLEMGLSYPSTRAIIKKRYKELVKCYHPDVNGSSKEAEEKFKAISVAYNVLSQCELFE